MTSIKNKTNKTLIVILGPTAVGKTSLAIELAKHFNTEIISADSRQFYREMRIGTSAPTPEELESAIHHFIGNLSVTDYYNVSKFENEALCKLEEIFLSNPFAIMVGGSGLYIDAVCKGIDELPDPDEKIRKELKEKYKNQGLESLQQQLKKLDPEYYSIVDISNPNRLMRAIEVNLITGKTFTSLRNNILKNREFEIIKIGLNRNREKLFNIINSRVDKMINTGLIDEVKDLTKYRNFNALNTVGYKEIFEYLDKKITLKQAIQNIKTNTRRYAKRQLTWFKKDESIKWFHPDDLQNIIEFTDKYF